MHRALRRALTALLTTVVVGLGTVTAVAPATAQPVTAAAAACSSRAGLPARVSIDRAYQEVRVPLQDSCYNDFVWLDLYGPQGYETMLDWDPAHNGALAYWDVYGWYTQPGTYRVREGYASPHNYTASTSTLVKFGSKAGLTAKRSGGRVTLTACASYYNGSRDAFVPWAGHKATIQKLGRDGRTWSYVKTVGTNRSGCAAHTVSDRYAGTYRVSTYETYQIFGRTSPSVRA
ncbi:hypothetical protein [Pseudokineococcus lusitanus]|uniref:Secreted protein n=1 Tax=Pseudokineococcus lusitanus TaxID=763993 RepID=A0A3N1HM38_9ACTN|nr:hypothetical protein [Pseudokineococcus lusitanus]ROP43598.1 hypothetical protein EDC03_1191 [Pseudokineococcus lusitanus]